ncbi:MAG: dienelactone hydrolase family protein [Chloroflexota bacterium]|nr:dienelactone hydrolase family protein [Dehalococcoidia bacterium]MDW8253410.1 dienelactone hydrolase family protein [Chloroflexota bacterium]
MAVLRQKAVHLPINGAMLDGTLVHLDDTEKRPGVVLIQEWWGIEPHVLELAHKLAAAGFVVFVPDHYHGRVATEPDEAGKEMMLLFENMQRAIKEIGASIEYLRGLDNVAPKKIGVMGFCMGGLLTYKAAETFGDQIGAAVPVYGVNYQPTVEEVAKVSAPILAIYGAQDPFVPREQIERVEQVYKQAGKDIRISIYPAGHAFINPDHGNLHPESAEKAWNEAVSFLRDKLR